MDLTVGPIAFFWTAEAVKKFYSDLARSSAPRVVIGEWVCSKRLPFWQDEIPTAVAALQDAGKEVAITSLALITLKRERKLTDDLLGMGIPVEVNDLSALRHMPKGTPFWVGPMVNVYNEGTLAWLARRGATRVCLPPELPLTAITPLVQAAKEEGVVIEVWAHGRAPLAISGRCYHARLTDRAKDSCQFVCADDPDGRNVDTMDGRAFLTVNGVQTLGHAVTTVAHQICALREAGVASLRLSPHVGDFGAIVDAYATSLTGSGHAAPTLLEELRHLMPGAEFCDGFLRGKTGSRLSPASGA